VKIPEGEDSTPRKEEERMSRAKAGDVLGCEVCGLKVIVDEECGCATIDLICCEEPMVNMGPAKPKKVQAASAPKKKTAVKKVKAVPKKKPAAKKKAVKKAVKKPVKKVAKKAAKKPVKKAAKKK
jgi:outer membrane biosynthesis protein TonB